MSPPWRWRPGEDPLPLWVLPTTGVIGALAIGSLLTTVDVADHGFLDTVTFRGGVEEARQLLAVISGTMITVTGLVFVLTVVALQLASTQFSPRLLKSFLADMGTQVVLATFVATFAYSIAGLHTVGRVEADGSVFVPRLAISVAMVLALLSVGMLVFYIQHVTDSIRIDTIMLHSQRDTLAAIDRQYPDPVGERPPTPPARPGTIIGSPSTGYLQGLDISGLVGAAAARDLLVVVTLMRGQHVLAASPAALVVSMATARIDLADGSELGPEGLVDVPGPHLTGSATRRLQDAIQVRPERSAPHDVGFGIRHLVDIASRAMSSGNNDPYTAVQAVHHLTAVLVCLSSRQLGWRVHNDRSGRPRVYEPSPTFAEHLALVCGEIRPFATRSLRLLAELLHLLARVAAVVTTPQDRAAVAGEIDLVVADAERVTPNPVDLEAVHDRARTARAALDGPRLTAPAI